MSPLWPCVARRAKTLALVVVLATVAAACSTGGSVSVTGTSRAVPTTATTSPAPSSSTSSSVPGSTSPPKAPAVTWRGCVPDNQYDCAKVEVPLVYADPGKGTTTIALERVPARVKSERIGTLFMDPGGPGGSGIDLLHGIQSRMPASLRDHFDLVGFDPRGVGQSDEIVCIPNKDATFGLDPDPDNEAEVRAYVDAQTATATSCTGKLGTKVTAYGTAAVARDLDRLRQAVGDDKLTYLGFSYGTLIGSVYATLFPDKVRALVLDGPVDPSDPDSGATQAAGFERAFSRYSAACSASPQCPAKPDARALYDQLKATAEVAPIPTSGSRPLTVGYLETAMAASLYDQDSWLPVSVGLVDASKGDGSLLLAIADNYNRRRQDGTYENLFDVFRVVGCDDDPRRPTLDDAKASAAKQGAANPFLGPSAGWGLYSCEGFPVGDEVLPTVSASASAPIVVIGTAGDPATPIENAARLSHLLGSGVTVTWDGEGHTATTKSPCIDDLVTAYLVSLSVPKDGTACSGTYPPEAGATPGSADPFVLNRAEIRTSLITDASKQLSKDRATCVVDGVLAKLDDQALVRFLRLPTTPQTQALIQQVAAGCPG